MFLPSFVLYFITKFLFPFVCSETSLNMLDNFLSHKNKLSNLPKMIKNVLECLPGSKILKTCKYFLWNIKLAQIYQEERD